MPLNPTTRIRFFGVAAYEIVTRDGCHVLVDPFLDENPGSPMAFVVYADEGVRFYHYGDTALFSDMKLQAELYRPTIGCIGIANPQEILARNPMPGAMLTGEMSPYEGALAARWLGLETVLPC